MFKISERNTEHHMKVVCLMRCFDSKRGSFKHIKLKTYWDAFSYPYNYMCFITT